MGLSNVGDGWFVNEDRAKEREKEKEEKKMEARELKMIRDFESDKKRAQYIEDLQSAVAQVHDLFTGLNGSYTEFQGVKYIIHQVTSDGWFFLTHDPGTIEERSEKVMTLKKDIKDKLCEIECEMRERGWYWH